MKARNYRKVKGQAYTRKKYIRGSPASKIVKFTMGDPRGKFAFQARLIAQKEVQIRHNALEAARIATNRILSEKLGDSYLLRILPYPHVVLREKQNDFWSPRRSTSRRNEERFRQSHRSCSPGESGLSTYYG